MRKVLSFVLVLSLVLGSLGMAFAAPMSDVAGKDFEEAVSVLSDLGVVTGYPDGTYKPDNIVTRAEMAVIVVRALGLADYATGTAKFSDMGGHWANPYVAYATSLGVIAGYPDGTFKPDKTVSYDEAATMLVAALGYTADSLVGTWPANFVTKAKTLGILDGIKAGVAGANRGDIATMTFQTLDQNIGKTDKDGVWAAIELKAGPPKVFDKMLGRLDAKMYAPGAGAYAPTAADADDFIVLGTEDSIINLKPFVGALVTAYANKDDEIIAIKEVKSTFLTGEFDAYGAGNTFTADDVKYDVVAMTAGFKAFTNGKVDALFAGAGAKEYKIAVDLSGLKVKDVYSVAEWTVSNSAQISATQIAAMSKDTPKLLNQTFTLNDSKKIDTDSFELVGVESLDKIVEDDVVYVYTGAGKITKVEVCNDVVTGEVTKIQGGSKYTVNGKAYKISAVAGAPAPGAPGVGDEIKAWIGPDGKIYDFETVSGTANKLAAVVNLGNGTVGAGLGNTALKIELFMADGTSKVFTAAKSKYDTAADPWYGTLLAAWGGGNATWTLVAGDVVKYDVNADGEISALTKVGLTGASAGTVKLTAKSTFDGYDVNSNATVITYTDAGAAGLPFSTDADDYAITTVEKLLNSDLDNVFFTTKNGKIDFLYVNSTSSSTDKIYGVVTDTEENNSKAGYGVDMLVDGAAKYYNSNTDYTGFDDGIVAPADGVNDFKLLYEIKFDSAGDISLTNVTAAAFATPIAKANVTSASGRIINIAGPAVRTLDKDAVIYVWNATDGVYEVGSITDIDEVSTVAARTGIILFDTDLGADADGIYDIVLVY
ncbi:hypothetical protein MASR2M70_05980 [Bacillota bacterium]